MTCKEAATILGCSGQRVRYLIAQGRLVSNPTGWPHDITEESVTTYAKNRKNGRPRKEPTQ